jgi:serine/threonine protein kinase
MEDLTGMQLGVYRILRPLGEGGMAAVFAAYQPSMDRTVAVKVLPRQFASDPVFLARFRQEATLVANLQHPNILTVYDFGDSDGYTSLVMPFFNGGNLSEK